MEIQQKESTKKAAASAAALSDAHHFSTGFLFSTPHSNTPFNSQQLGDSVVANMAKWLDRASAVLAHDSGKFDTNLESKDPVKYLATSEVEFQLKEVKELIYEGPKIQHTSVGLQKLLCTSPGLSSIHDRISFANDDDDSVIAVPSPTPPLKVHTSAKRKISASETPLKTEIKGTRVERDLQRQESQLEAVPESLGGDDKDPPKNKCCLSPEGSSSADTSSLQPSKIVANSKDAEALVGFLETVRSAEKKNQRALH